ncbi:hypothetical protein VPH35_139780 [Triticum aestivum]|uniref:F-box domain-containing protein n=1 Tax=Aegilops tauschii TaxID=37682 RepID=M8BJR0_AEGTA
MDDALDAAAKAKEVALASMMMGVEIMKVDLNTVSPRKRPWFEKMQGDMLKFDDKSSWCPWDLLDRILQHLELPGALAVSAVCTSWRSAAAASGVPRSGMPWLVSCDPERLTRTEGSEFQNVLDPGKMHVLITPPDYIGRWFYQKVVLSCDPSPSHDSGGEDFFCESKREPLAACHDESCEMGKDSYADCAHHNGRFYTVTMRGVVEAWDLDIGPPHQPGKQAIIADGDGRHRRILTRFLVSTPWGGLLEIRTQRRSDHPRRVIVEAFEVDVEERRLVRLSSATAIREHAVFVGLSESVCLRAEGCPGVRPNHVYFATPWLTHEENFGLQGWKGVVIYDLESQTFDSCI